jgi:hypothetical protein
VVFRDTLKWRPLIGTQSQFLFGGLFVLCLPNIAAAVSSGLLGAVHGVIMLLVTFPVP